MYRIIDIRDLNNKAKEGVDHRKRTVVNIQNAVVGKRFTARDIGDVPFMITSPVVEIVKTYSPKNACDTILLKTENSIYVLEELKEAELEWL